MLMDANSPRVSDLMKCRLCFEEENSLIYIYEVSGCLKNVAKAITDVLSYEISIDDQFPPYVCICCCGKLLEFRAFKVKCDSLRERYKLLLSSREDATNSIEEKVEIEEGSLDKDEQMFDTNVIEENSAFDNSQVEIEEESLDKDQQMVNTNVREEFPAFDKYQVEIEEESLDKDEQMVDTSVNEENSAFDEYQVVQNPQGIEEKEIEVPIAVEEQDRALRCRKAVKYNMDQSGSEASDPESSDSFCPSNQGDTDGSDDSLSSDGIERKRSQVCRGRAGTATARNNPGSGAAGLEEVADGRSGQIGCDPGTVEGCTGESSAISTTSSGNNGYTGSIVGGTSQMSRPWVGLTSSDAQQSSESAEMTTSQSDLSHNIVNMSSEHSPYSVQIVGKDTCRFTTKDPVQLTNDSIATETHSVTNISHEYPCRNVASGKENIASHPSESITLKELLKCHSFSPEVSNSSLLQSDTLSSPKSLSLSWRDLLENEVASSSRMASSSQTTSVCPSFVDVSGERVMCNDDSSGCTPSRIDSQCILQGRNSVDSAVMKQSFSEQRNGSTGEAEKQMEQNGLKGRLYPGISTIDLKSFGISLETDVDDPVDGDSVGRNTEDGDQSLWFNAKEGGMIRSGSNMLGLSGTLLTGESSNRAIPTVGNTSVQQSKHVEETRMLNGDKRTNADRIGVLDTESSVVFSTQVQDGMAEVVKDSIPGSSKSITSAETPSYSNSVGTLSNTSYKPSCGIREGGANDNASNQSNVVTLASESIHVVPSCSDSFPRLNSAQNLQNTPIPRAFSPQTYQQRINSHRVPATSNTFSQEVPVCAGNPNAVNTYATGYVPSSTSSRYPSGYRNAGGSLPGSTKEGLMTFQESILRDASRDITVSAHFHSGSFESHPRMALRNHLLERTLSVGNSGCVVNAALIQRKELLPTLEESNEETYVSQSTIPYVFPNTSVRSGIDTGSSAGDQGYPYRVCDRPALATSQQIATVHKGHIINTNNSSSRQGYLSRDPPTVQPSRMNSYNHVSQCSVTQGGPSSGVLNINTVSTFHNRNVAPLDISGNLRSTYRRPVSYSREQFLSACQRYVPPSTSRYVPASANLVSQPEMRNNSQQSLSASLLDVTLPKRPWEIAVLAKRLFQPEMMIRGNIFSHRQNYDLLSTSRNASASTNHVSQPEMRRNSLSSSEICGLLSTSSNATSSTNPVSQPEMRQNISEVERDDESSDSLSSAADVVDSLEDTLAGEKPETKKTKEYLCDVCGSVFYNAFSLFGHRKGVHGEKRFKCSKCPKAFILKHHLQQHMSMHDDSRPFVCKECGSRFKLKTHLRQHVVVHSKKAMFQCSHCDKGFHTKWQHDNHQPSHEGKVVWSCDGCTEKLTTWVAYQDHLLEHKKNRTFKCDTCSKEFNSKRNLKAHVISHLKQFKCTVCGRRFGFSKSLHLHMRVHTGERPYACKFCGKRFARNEGLKVHLSVHSDVRPFKCRFCDYGAKVKSELKRHEKIHLRYQIQNFISPNSR